MSASVVEVKNDETFAYYSGYIKDFQKDQLLVHFDNGWKPDEWVPPQKVRQAVARHDPLTFNPQVGDEVEAMAKSHEEEPFSWWRAKVKTIRGDFYLINYSDWDDTYNEIVEKEYLRPPNKNPCLDARNLLKVEVDVPQDLQETEVEQQDQKIQSAKQNKYAEIQITSGLLSLIEDPGRHKLMLLGSKAAVDKGNMFAQMHFKHMTELQKLKRKAVEQQKLIESEFRKVSEGYVEEFSIRPELTGLVIGKKGKNIRDAEKIPGVVSVKVNSQDGVVKIVAQHREAALEARRMLEYVEEVFAIQANRVGKIVGPKFAHIVEIEKNSKVHRISIDRKDPAPQKGNKKDRRRQPRNDEDDDVFTNLRIVGTKETVANALHMIKDHINFVNELDRERDKLNELDKQRRSLNDTYGLKISRLGGPREDQEFVEDEDESSETKDYEKSNNHKSYQQSRQPRYKAKSTPNGSDTSATATTQEHLNGSASAEVTQNEESEAKDPRTNKRRGRKSDQDQEDE